MLRRMLNGPERITYHRLREACARHSAEVYAKVRLADVLGVEGSGLSDRLYSFALQAHYDFVITDLAQAPLFAVEFDGPQHDAPEQVERDAQKDELSRRFGLPLVRVRATDLCRTEWKLDRLTEVAEQWFEQRNAEPGTVSAGTPYPAMESFTGGGNVTEMRFCPQCGSRMMVKNGKYGSFLSCVRYPLCKGSCELPTAPAAASPEPRKTIAPAEHRLRKPALIAAGVGLLLGISITALLAWSRADRPRENRQPSAVTGTEPATARQMNLLGLLIRRRGWDAAERDAQMRSLLGYNRGYTELSKQEASKLITAWDDREK